MELPKIEIKKTGKTYKVISHGYTYGENMTQGEANRLKQSMDHYRSVASMELLCQGLDGDSPQVKAEFLPLTAEQLNKLQHYGWTGVPPTHKDNLLVHQGSGAVFYITKIDVRADHAMSNLVAAGVEIELTARNSH